MSFAQNARSLCKPLTVISALGLTTAGCAIVPEMPGAGQWDQGVYVAKLPRNLDKPFACVWPGSPLTAVLTNESDNVSDTPALRAKPELPKGDIYKIQVRPNADRMNFYATIQGVMDGGSYTLRATFDSSQSAASLKKGVSISGPYPAARAVTPDSFSIELADQQKFIDLSHTVAKYFLNNVGERWMPCPERKLIKFLNTGRPGLSGSRAQPTPIHGF